VNEARTIPSPMLGFWESRLLFLFLFLSSVGAFGCWSLSSTSTTHLLVFRSPGNVCSFSMLVLPIICLCQTAIRSYFMMRDTRGTRERLNYVHDLYIERV